jgi:hypothetical protein
MRFQDVFDTAKQYLQRHPEELGRVLRGLLGLRLGVPLDAIRWLAAQAARSGSARDIEIDSVPPGFRVAATFELMRTTVRGAATLYVERMRLTGEEARIELRLEDVTLSLVEDATTPVALLIKSGALDLSRPANLLKHLPTRPPFLLEARDNRVVLDFIRHPAIAANDPLRHALHAVTSVVTLHGLETDERHFDFTFRAFPGGLGHAARSLRQHLFAPAVERARLLLPSGRCRAVATG